MNCLVIYNPAAGNGRAAGLYQTIAHYLQQSTLNCDIRKTEYAGHAIELLRDTQLSDYDAVIASGGDGTLFEVVNGLMQNKAQHKPRVGLIPNGTGNAFMKELDLERHQWQEAIHIIEQGKTRDIDVGVLGSSDKAFYFLNIVGTGFVSTVAQAAIPLKWMGNAAYTVATLLKLMNLRAQSITLQIDGQILEREAVFVEVANSRYTGTTFLMAPQAKVDDGKLDVVLLNKISRMRLLRLFNSIYDGSHIHYPEVEYFQASEVRINCDSAAPVVPDGEIMEVKQHHFKVLPRALSFLWR